MDSMKICAVLWSFYNKGKKPQHVFYTVNTSLELVTLTNAKTYLTEK